MSKTEKFEMTIAFKQQVLGTVTVEKYYTKIKRICMGNMYSC